MALVASVTGAAACASAPRKTGQEDGCQSLPPAEARPRLTAFQVAAPTSRLVVSAGVPLSRVRAELERRVPKLLDSAKRRKIGAPGEVTYEVTRGGFDLNLRGERLLVSTIVKADVDVCKPLGPICFSYGRCTPRLLATASVPLLLGETYDFQKSTVRTQVTRPCVIAGIDASPHIKALADQQARAVEQRIDTSLPRIRGFVEQAWQFVQAPLRYDLTHCLTLRPKRLVQGRPTIDGGAVQQRWALESELALSSACSAGAATEASLPPLATDPALADATELHLVQRVGWSSLEAAITLAMRGGPLGVTRVRAVPVSNRGVRQIEIGLTTTREYCGELVAWAEPSYDAASDRVALTRVEFAAAQRADDTALGAARDALARVRVALPASVSQLGSRVRSGLGLLSKSRAGIVPKLEVADPQITRVDVETDGVVAIASIRATLAVGLE
jgi:hypothetical protein